MTTNVPTGTVICGLDGSSTGPALARIAAGVAQLLGAPLDLVHVLGGRTPAPARGDRDPGAVVAGAWRDPADARTAETALEADARAMLDALPRSPASVAVRRHVLDGEPAGAWPSWRAATAHA